jgi:alpha-beta hydrolase superfamily lysophospholipase/molecular chaperone GrpE (heat shock protein)
MTEVRSGGAGGTRHVGPVAQGEAGTLRGGDGLRLEYRVWRAPAESAALVLVHGLGDHAGRYADFGQALAQSGISTWALDLRGHGRSGGRRGHMPSFDTVLHDVELFRGEVGARAGAGTPLFLFGHSMGGLIAVRYLQEYGARFRGAVIASPWLATAMAVPQWKVLAGRVLSRVLPALPIRHGLHTGHLSRDAEVVRAYNDDPLVHGVITPRAFAEISAAMDLVPQRSERLALPLLFLLAGDDRIVDTRHALTFARAIDAPDVSIEVYPGHYHELINEVERHRVYRQVATWILAHADSASCSNASSQPLWQRGVVLPLHAAGESVDPLPEGSMTDEHADPMPKREPTQPGAFEELIDGEPPNVTEAEPLEESAAAAGDRREPDAPYTGDNSVSRDETEAEARQIEQDMESLQREFSVLSDRHLRLAAEFDNYRKRVERERGDAWTRAQGDLVGRLLDTLDDLERVSAHADTSMPDALLQGVQLVERKLRQVLEAAGLEPVDAEGARFDHNEMEAVAMVAAESPDDDDLVSDVFQRGYTFKGTLLRPARVRVMKHGA